MIISLFLFQVCHISLNRGLFLCYLQARSTVDGGIEVAVCNTSPSILPYVKIRDNPHVNSDEWTWIYRLSTTGTDACFLIARQAVVR